MRSDLWNDNHTIVTAAGTWTGTNPTAFNGHLEGVRVRPATVSTIYSIRIVDADDFEVYNRKAVQGELIEDMKVPVNGLLTAHIEDATADEAFTLKTMAESQ